MGAIFFEQRQKISISTFAERHNPVILQRDNARLYIANITNAAIQQIGLNVIS